MSTPGRHQASSAQSSRRISVVFIVATLVIVLVATITGTLYLSSHVPSPDPRQRPAPTIALPGTTDLRRTPFPVTVWLRSDAGIKPYQTLVEHAAQVSFASPFAYRITTSGQVVRLLDPEQTKLLRQAQTQGVKVTATIVDDTAATGWDHPDTIANILASPQTFIETMRAMVVSDGWDGLDLDLESIPQAASSRQPGWNAERVIAQSSAYSAMVSRLSQTLHGAGKLLSVTAFSRLGQRDWEGAAFFDYATLSTHVDQLRIMAYDENGPTWGDTQGGPIASTEFVQDRLLYALGNSQVSKLVIGLPWYGYRFKSSTDTNVTYSQIASEAKPETLRRQDYELTYQTHDNHTVWYNDALSTRLRLVNLVRYLEAHGASVRQISGVAGYSLTGDEPPGFWEALDIRRPLAPAADLARR